jgi:hypothetical protein
MIVTAWKNGTPRKSGAGYGVKILPEDRDTYFRQSWEDVIVELPDGNRATVNVAKKSFWGSQCSELISAAIGRWLLGEGLAPWTVGRPPKLELVPTDERRFSLRRP